MTALGPGRTALAATPGIPVGWRSVLVAAVAASLAAGLYAGLQLLGVPVPMLRPRLGEVHGPVMVLGVVGTLVALERAVALGARWALAAPGCAAAGGLTLLAAGPVIPGRLLLAAGGAALLVIYVSLWRRQATAAVLTQAAGAFAWYAAALLWLGGFGIAETVPWLAGFVVLTIAGERLELAGIEIGRDAERWFLVVAGVLSAGLAASTLWPGFGHQLWGLSLLALVFWLFTYDVARRTVRSRGLARYVAAGLLAGYGWLAVAGLLWAGAGLTTSGTGYDALLHAVFLGFTFSMIFVHAPVILPAVLRRPLPYHPLFYLPLVLLHLSLLVRLVMGDLAGFEQAWRWSGVGNVAALVLFGILVVTSAVRARASRPRSPAVPVPAGRR